MSLDPSLRARIKALLQANPVVLFMKGEPGMPQCGFSAKASGTLEGLGVAYAHVDVLADQEIREGIKEYGSWPTIPQLYVNGELVGGSDIIEQMANSGELGQLLGLPPVDRTPPSITVTPAAAEKLRGAMLDNGRSAALALTINAQFQTQFQIVPINGNAIATETKGLRFQFDPASAKRANGIIIDWVDDFRGQGLSIDNPNAPRPVESIPVQETEQRVRAGSLVLVDVRPPEERATASVNLPFKTFDDDGMDELENLAKDTPLAFICHRGGRSAQAAEHFNALGFTEVYNVDGGIDAWATLVDASIPRY
ncbi:MAG: Grx4 family monothiol glutaredoxin [Xanthomonadaceae bacterium]|jgi:monothiol glutaredoxin|nr:Grx4 family monothiol glutaredoxin [Xanthomonadaceae bacterium]